jgi:hypothetical protein
MRIQMRLFVLCMLLVMMTACQTSGGPIEPLPTHHTLTVNVLGSGTVTATVDGEAVDLRGNRQFERGTEVVLNATPDNNLVTNWGGACAGATGNTCSVLMNGDKTVDVIFQQAGAPPARYVGATPSSDQAVDSLALLPGENVIYGVTVPGGRPPALFLEVDNAGVELEVYNEDGTFFDMSASPSFFFAGDRTQAVTPGDAALQSVATLTRCIGPCVIRRTRAQSETVFVRLVNTTGSTVSYQFYAYTRSFDDENEPNNGTRANAVPFSSDEAGALETLEDQDWFQVTSSGTLTFTAQQGSLIEHRVAVYESSTTSKVLHVLEPGDSVNVIGGNILQVYADPASNKAGPSATSAYYFSLQ